MSNIQRYYNAVTQHVHDMFMKIFPLIQCWPLKFQKMYEDYYLCYNTLNLIIKTDPKCLLNVKYLTNTNQKYGLGSKEKCAKIKQ